MISRVGVNPDEFNVKFNAALSVMTKLTEEVPFFDMLFLNADRDEYLPMGCIVLKINTDWYLCAGTYPFVNGTLTWLSILQVDPA